MAFYFIAGLFGVIAALSFLYQWFLADAYEDTAIFIGFGAVAVALVFALLGLAHAADAEHARLMRQCMADGHPEYECYSKLKQEVVPMPIVIPVGR